METLTARTNIDIAQKGFNDFLQGNIAAVLDACSKDIVWSTWPNPAVPYAKNYYGKEGVATFFQTLGSSVEYTVFNPKKFYAAENKVFAFVDHKATVKATGKTFEHETLMVFTIDDGKMSGFHTYADTADMASAFTQ
ncbi:MAG: nuclear transport factor 2 family protein [Bacteroidetes bacterium]|nr:nuclear transport factor 2 family protein [Bacteroidota bacterium]